MHIRKDGGVMDQGSVCNFTVAFTLAWVDVKKMPHGGGEAGRPWRGICHSLQSVLQLL